MENSEPSSLLRGKGFCDQQWFLPVQGAEVTRSVTYLFNSSAAGWSVLGCMGAATPRWACLLLTGTVKCLNHQPTGWPLGHFSHPLCAMGLDLPVSEPRRKVGALTLSIGICVLHL